MYSPIRKLQVHPMRSYFPSLTERADRLLGIQRVNEEVGYAPGPSAIVSVNLDGTALQAIHPPKDSGFMWGTLDNARWGWIFFAKGARFGAVD